MNLFSAFSLIEHNNVHTLQNHLKGKKGNLFSTLKKEKESTLRFSIEERKVGESNVFLCSHRVFGTLAYSLLSSVLVTLQLP